MNFIELSPSRLGVNLRPEGDEFGAKLAQLVLQGDDVGRRGRGLRALGACLGEGVLEILDDLSGETSDVPPGFGRRVAAPQHREGDAAPDARPVE